MCVTPVRGNQPRSGEDRQAMMRNYLSSRKRIMLKDAKEAGQDFDVHGWMQANASWASYSAARAKISSEKPALTQSEVLLCSRGLIAGFVSSFRSVNPWYFTSAGAKYRSHELAPVEKWLAVVEGRGNPLVFFFSELAGLPFRRRLWLRHGGDDG